MFRLELNLLFTLQDRSGTKKEEATVENPGEMKT